MDCCSSSPPAVAIADCSGKRRRGACRGEGEGWGCLPLAVSAPVLKIRGSGRQWPWLLDSPAQRTLDCQTLRMIWQNVLVVCVGLVQYWGHAVHCVPAPRYFRFTICREFEGAVALEEVCPQPMACSTVLFTLRSTLLVGVASFAGALVLSLQQKVRKGLPTGWVDRKKIGLQTAGAPACPGKKASKKERKKGPNLCHASAVCNCSRQLSTLPFQVQALPVPPF